MFTHRVGDGVDFAVSENIETLHGFSTRIGGVSTLSGRESMNLGYDRGDDPDCVAENYRRFVSAVTGGRYGPERIARADQIHSDTVRYAGAPGKYEPCDGFWTDVPGVILTVRVADCAPVLLYDKEAGICAALHAGWRSTVLGIAEKGVEAIVSHGGKASRIRAAVGPCIHVCCFEVKEDFVKDVEKLRGTDFSERHLLKRDGRLFADIAAMNTELLEGCGLLRGNISISTDCTRCMDTLYFSHRALGVRRGSMCAAIAL